MIARINATLVPVWIDVRTQPIPAVPGIEQTLEGTTLDAERRVSNGFSQGFFVRNLVLTADGELLNPETRGPLALIWAAGHLPYAQVTRSSFDEMLDRAAARFAEIRATRQAVALTTR